MPILSFGRLAGALLAGLFMASCTVVVDEEPRPGPPRPGGPPQACTFEYAPVCAERGRDRQTFGNACQARVDGYRIVSQGECRRGGGGVGPGPDRGPQACTREYQPVCAARGGREQTFGNECVARADGFRVIYDGECRTGRPDRPGRPGGPGLGDRPGAGGGVCTREFAPVCARRGDDVRTFGNACEAESARYRIVRPGQC